MYLAPKKMRLHSAKLLFRWIKKKGAGRVEKRVAWFGSQIREWRNISRFFVSPALPSLYITVPKSLINGVETPNSCVALFCLRCYIILHWYYRNWRALRSPSRVPPSSLTFRGPRASTVIPFPFLAWRHPKSHYSTLKESGKLVVVFMACHHSSSIRPFFRDDRFVLSSRVDLYSETLGCECSGSLVHLGRIKAPTSPAGERCFSCRGIAISVFLRSVMGPTIATSSWCSL